jgi:serine/threonine protein kinase
MDPERWRQIERLCLETLERASEERAGFLDATVAGDADLRRQVESLLAYTAPTDDPLDRSTSAGVTRLVRELIEPSLPPGTILGHYRIDALLGTGGMGRVYRAVDTRLGRAVALKFLNRTFLADGSARLVGEARAAARLDHPNICSIYEVVDDENCFIAMQYLEGDTLAARIRRGPIDVSEALEIASQIADALVEAHAKGVVHRDIKPQNIIITPRGQAMVLDFGLAHSITPVDSFINEVAEPQHVSATVPVAGTVAYMSPEQASGQPLDARSDIFSFGVMLYELLAGRRPFAGRTDLETLQQVIHEAPMPLREELPPALRIAVDRALAKDVAKRYQSMREMVVDLRSIARRGDDLPAAKLLPATSVRPSIGWWKWAALLFVAAMASSPWSLWHSQPSADAARDDYAQLTNFADSVTSPAISPDGRTLTFIRGISSFQGPGQIYVKSLPDGEPRKLTQDGLNKMSPVFSPDGSRIAYTTVDDSNEWDTWDVPVLGGPPRKWLPNASGLVWVDKHNVLFSEKIRDSRGNHMKVVAATESRAEARDLYVPLPKGAMAHRSFPSPDGRWVVVVEMDDRGDWLPCRVVPMDGSSTGRQVGPPGAPCWFAAWSPNGEWMYLNSLVGGTFQIVRQRFSERGALSTPEPLTSGPLEHEGISITADGRSLVTAMGLKKSAIWLVSAQGERQGSREGHAEHAAFQPDWNARQISLEGYARHPKVTPDGKRLLYLTGKSASDPKELWMADLDTGRNERALPGFRMTENETRRSRSSNPEATHRVPYDVSPDGQHVVVEISDDEGKNQLWLAPLDRRSPPRRIPNVEGDGPLFLSNEEVVFRGREGDYGFAYRVRTDGTALRKVSDHSVISTTGLSRDGQWLVVYARPGEEQAGVTLALPLEGGLPIQIVGRDTRAAWSASGRQLVLSEGIVGAAGTTYIVPLSRGQAFPAILSNGLLSTKAVASLPGVQVIDSADVAPGPTPGVFALSRVTVQLNIYRIPTP